MRRYNRDRCFGLILTEIGQECAFSRRAACRRCLVRREMGGSGFETGHGNPFVCRSFPKNWTFPMGRSAGQAQGLQLSLDRRASPRNASLRGGGPGGRARSRNKPRACGNIPILFRGRMQGIFPPFFKKSFRRLPGQRKRRRGTAYGGEKAPQKYIFVAERGWMAIKRRRIIFCAYFLTIVFFEN